MLNGSAIAQTFTIPASKVGIATGTFLTQIGVYFSSKSVTYGVDLFVCQTNNGVPNSTKTLGKAKLVSSQVTTSSDSTSETIFVLDNPVFLTSGKQYAFIVVPESSNPDYNLWVSNLGDNDIITGLAINKQPYAGVLLGSSDGSSWTPYLSQNMKFNLYRAQFNSQSGRAIFRNKKKDFITLSNITNANTSTQILIGDIAIAANSLNTSQFLTSDFTKYPYGVVEYVDEANGVYRLNGTNGLFNVSTWPNLRFFRVTNPSNTAQYTLSNLIANATLTSIDNPPYDAIITKFLVTAPPLTSLSYNYFGIANSSSSYTRDTAPSVPTQEKIYEFRDHERVIMSYSNEKAAGIYGNVGTSTYIIEFGTNNYYLSPSVRLDTKIIDYVDNLINNDITNEETRYGNAMSKYISKVITLNQTAEDLHVYITGYRPVGTDLVVWAKFLNSDSDTDGFDNKLWTKLAYTNGTDALFSSPQDPTDVKEFTYGLPTTAVYTNSAYANQSPPASIVAGTVTYTNPLGTIIYGFNQFAIKVDLISDNSALYPFMKDIRGIALQM